MQPSNNQTTGIFYRYFDASATKVRTNLVSYRNLLGPVDLLFTVRPIICRPMGWDGMGMEWNKPMDIVGTSAIIKHFIHTRVGLVS